MNTIYTYVAHHRAGFETFLIAWVVVAFTAAVVLWMAAGREE